MLFCYCKVKCFIFEREFSSPSSISFSLNKMHFLLIKFLCFIYHHTVSHCDSSFVVSINYYCVTPTITLLVRSVLNFVKIADNIIGCINVVKYKLSEYRSLEWSKYSQCVVKDNVEGR